MTEVHGNQGVLVVDDEPAILASVRDLLEDEFLVSTTEDPATALRMLEHEEVAVILSDQRMPGVTGDQFLKLAKERSQATRVLITGYSDIGALVRAVNGGHIYAYVAKPWDAMEFKLTVLRAAQHYQLLHDIQESEHRYRSLFEEAPVGYVEIDKNADVTAVNRAATALLGCSQSDLVGQCFSDLMSAASRETPEHNLNRLASTFADDVLEQDFIRRDGESLTLELHRSPILTNAGDLQGLRAAMLNITARKLAEQTSKKYALELAIKNEELGHALQRANEAVALKSRFLAKMSHELRTPLNGIIGLSEVLHDGLPGDLSQEQKEFVGDVLASGRHLLTLVNNLLDLECVELEKMAFSSEVVETARLLVEVRDVLRTVAADNHITISVMVDPSLSRVMTDPVRLRQIIYNFLSNAIKFSPAGGRVEVRAVPHQDASFRVEVTDMGPGIAPCRLSAVFDDFQQVEVARKAPSQGAGLGLALTKRIVEAQGGTVGVRSILGEGSTFYAILPNRLSQISTEIAP
jgi:two-component system, cell cycle sensor histidine kinase PleC